MSNKDLLNISVDLGAGNTYQVNLEDDLRISKDSINDDLMQQAGKAAWWGTLQTLAEELLSKKKKVLDDLEARLDLDIRSGVYFYKHPDIKELDKMTESAIKSYITCDPDVSKAREEVISVARQRGVLLTAKAAFDHRRDMLQSYAYNLRQQYQDVSAKSIYEEAVNRAKKNKTQDVT